MDATRWTTIERLFDAALAIPITERDAFLDSATGDPAIRAEIQALLSEHEATGPFDALAAELAGASEETIDEPPPIGTRFGAWRIVSVLGRGGMGTVCEAERDDGQFEQRVAIKLLRRADPESHSRFLAERRILGRLTHPNIARILDGGVTDDGRPWFAMELVDGEPIDRWCAAHALSVRDRLLLFLTVCRSVEFAHRHLVVHRDLKPSNVLVTADGTAKLLDFGIAGLHEDAGAATEPVRLLPLTPAYASPEQLAGSAITTSSDVYQLGLLLVELLTNTRTPPSRALRGDLAAIAGMALQPEPERRYPSAAVLADDVQRHLDHHPVVARPRTPVYRTARFLVRHRLAAGIAAVGLAVAVAFGATFAAQARRVARERDRAERVSTLLVDLFRSADPWVARGDSITVHALLAAAPARVRAELADEPEARATMLATLAAVFGNLGLPADARELLGEVVSIRREVLAADHPDLADALVRYGIAHISTGDVRAALPFIEEGARLTERRRGTDPALRARIRAEYAYALHLNGRIDEARDRYRAAIEELRTRPDYRDTYARALANLGWLEDVQGNSEAARNLLQEALEVRRAATSGPDPDVANSLSALAQSLLAAGDAAAAEPLALEALGIRRAVFPDSHPRIRESLHTLAGINSRLGRDAAADSLYRSALAMARSAEGASDIARVSNDYAVFLRDRGGAAAAVPLFESAIAAYAAALGDDAASTHVARANLASTLTVLGRAPDAVPLFDAALPALARAWSDDDARLGQWTVDYGVALSLVDRLDEAESVLRRALAIETAALPPGHWRIIRAQGVLGACLTRLGRYDEAEPLMLGSYEQLQSQRGDADPYTRDALNNLIRFYERWGKPDRAAHFRART